MTERMTRQLYDEKIAHEFYEDRYRRGYMEEWPVEKKERVAEIIRALLLPESGEALDFGCGNGVFTAILREALPQGWKVYGSDISTQAIANARSRYPSCNFFVPGDPEVEGKRFDFLFTHHVLEHVADLTATIDLMNGLLAGRSTMLHILPCGNPGSFEHRLAAMRRGGIEPDLENRFFFEDEGHIRRLTTDALAGQFGSHAFHLEQEYYSHQHDGAIDWITQYNAGFVRDIADPSKAVDAEAARELVDVQRRLLSISRCRDRAGQYRYRLSHPSKSWKQYLYLLLYGPSFLRARLVDRAWRSKASEEWAVRKRERCGSEMYLFFRREEAPHDARE
jgi:SAM-dependent methyltransferase